MYFASCEGLGNVWMRRESNVMLGLIGGIGDNAHTEVQLLSASCLLSCSRLVWDKAGFVAIMIWVTREII